MRKTLKISVHLSIIAAVLAPMFFLEIHSTQAREVVPVMVSSATAVPILHVPEDVADLQSAINQIPDGGIIEMADGTYYAPNNGLGFVIHNLKKGFTIRAAEGATVILDGGGTRQILHFVNTDLSLGGWVTFEGITFANGYSTTDGLAGGVTMQKAQATFIDSVFRNNVSKPPLTGAGGIAVSIYSTAFFFDCTWRDNVAKNYGAGLAVQDNATAYVHHSWFYNNRTNDVNHANWAAGGGIHVGNSRLRVSNSRFENNQAGYVGGAIYVIGNWRDPASVPTADVIIANSTFYQNMAVSNGVSLPSPTQGGAVHVEDQARTRIYNSRFILNTADIGGGLNLYRGETEVYDSVFLGNRAVGVGGGNGFGGAIAAVSNDDVIDGNINRPPVQLIVVDTYIQGRYNGVSTVGQSAGGIYVAGDQKRLYGLSGVRQMGSAADNQAVAIFNNVAIHDTDVIAGQAGASALGGGITVDLVNLTMDAVQIQNAAATETTAYGVGGGICVFNQSDVLIENSTVAYNAADDFGGGLFIQGTHFTLQNSLIFGNELSPGVSESPDISYGAAIYSDVYRNYGINVTGSVDNNIFSENVGLPIFDNEQTNGPINDVRYNANQIFSSIFSDEVYSLGGASSAYWRLSVPELNNAIIYRTNGIVTDKVQIDNIALATRPDLGAIHIVPSQILPISAYGDGTSLTPAYLVYAWSGMHGAALDGAALTAKNGAMEIRTTGVHLLNVGDEVYQDDLVMGVAPQATLSGDVTQITWNMTQGTFLEGAMDQGLVIPSTPSGTISSGITPNQIYRYYAITEEGGVVAYLNIGEPILSVPASLTVLAGLNREQNRGYLPVQNIGGRTMDWSASTATPWLQILTDSGSTDSYSTIIFDLDIAGFSPGIYTASIFVDAGAAGSKNVEIKVAVVDTVYDSYFPLARR